MIVEFDGLPHYTNPDVIEKDINNKKIYESCGYKVVRIPYFIQLSNDAVKLLFGVTVAEPLFDESIPSLGIKGRNSPAYLCPAGIRKMAKDFLPFPRQYEVNVKALKNVDNPILSGIEYLEEEMRKLQKKYN